MKKAQMAMYVVILCVGLSPSLDSAVDKKSLTKLQALEIVRALNTAELDTFLQHKNYAPLVPTAQRFRGKTEGLDELVTSSADAPSGRIRDYEVFGHHLFRRQTLQNRLDPDSGVSRLCHPHSSATNQA